MDEIKEVPRIYCINLRSSQDRRERMDQRFKHHSLLDRVVYVNAVSRDTGLVDYYGEAIQDPKNLHKHRNEMACFASHLKAIRVFLEDTSKFDNDGAIICEDDVLLFNDFSESFVRLFSNVPPGINLVALGYIVWNWTDFKWAGIQPDKLNLCRFNPDNLWGTQMYWISRRYATEVLSTYDKPMQFMSGRLTSEVIVRFSNGYIAYPPLVLEDGIDSIIRPVAEMIVHYRTQSRWDYKKYADAEQVHLSPLATLQAI